MAHIHLHLGKILVVLMVVVVLAASIACAAAPVATPTPSGPSITITAPTNGSTVAAGNVTVTVKVANFSLVDKLGQTNVAGQGHIHYFKDVDAPTTAGKPAVTAAGTYAATAATSYTWPNVTAGKHTFSVELINNDHTPLATPVVVKVTVTVSGSAGQTPAATATAISGY